MKKAVLLAASLLALGSPAALAAEGGLYLGLHGGVAFVEGMKNESDAGSFNLEFDPGWLAGGTIGYDLRDAFPDVGTGRIELEFSWRENDVDEAEFVQPSSGAKGRATAASIMLNTIGEHRPSLPWIPYIGIGAGAARITLDKITEGGNPFVDDEDTVFAWQILAGIGYQVAPRLYLDLGYRYFSTVDPKFTDAAGVDFESEYVTHNVTLGARIDF